ncbi:MAG: aspartate aminotransferase family protein [Rikenellaceae bacterium]
MTLLRQLFFEHVGQTSDNPIGVEVSRAEGIYLYSPEGKRYVDLISGVSVSNVGHGNSAVVDAVCEQVKDYMHLMVYGEYVQTPQVKYAQKITSLLPEGLDSVYFVSTGSEAIEGAMKLAKRFTARTEMISFKNAYHGSTHGALSLMGGEDFRYAFRPLLPDVKQLSYGEFSDIEAITERTACVVVEPIQGEGGIIIPPKGYLQALRERCSEVGALLIFDEIQVGFFRTGAPFRFMQEGVVPDILCTAKAFGGGMPLAAFISSDEIMSTLKNNPVLGHITTFGGHPVCCAAGMAALDYILDNELTAQVEAKGAIFEDALKVLPVVKEVRRAGLIMAIDLGDAALAEKVVWALVEAGYITEWFLFYDKAFRIAPPLTISEDECREVVFDIVSVLSNL